ncbi:DUF7344 domain-containing protein [Natronorubrum daqingense]|uniref:DUF7344 domain-containing protein n=1 Tax=Natronorubrum daqingense TaxID=588898 RepID=A0A1N7CH61_9EURY|nr:hypothetical protein [Natronorubrum daqingense]APX96902.1 hypothetical protein BB347_09860 [Natronorubrum daqingense]SIR62853.1 hypothetical protein SAMN05421809_1700 [Natronorubrum daqingense]
MPDTGMISHDEDELLETAVVVLSHPWRRFFARYATRYRSGTFLVDEFATALTDRVVGPLDLTDVQTKLRHVHLPKLADAGLLEYDLVAERISPNYELLDGALDSLRLTVEEIQHERADSEWMGID